MVKEGTWCTQYSVIPEKRCDIMGKAPPRIKEMEEYFMPGSLPVQPQVTMGSGLVDLVVTLAGTVLADVELR